MTDRPKLLTDEQREAFEFLSDAMRLDPRNVAIYPSEYHGSNVAVICYSTHRPDDIVQIAPIAILVTPNMFDALTDPIQYARSQGVMPVPADWPPFDPEHEHLARGGPVAGYDVVVTRWDRHLVHPKPLRVEVVDYCVTYEAAKHHAARYCNGSIYEHADPMPVYPDGCRQVANLLRAPVQSEVVFADLPTHPFAPKPKADEPALARCPHCLTDLPCGEHDA